MFHKLLDTELNKQLKQLNVYDHQIEKMCLTRDEQHLVVFVNSLTWTKTEINNLIRTNRFCRLDFIGKDKIALRFLKKGV